MTTLTLPILYNTPFRDNSISGSASFCCIPSRTIGKIHINKWSLVHPRGDFTHESKGFVITTWCATREILASKFSDPYVITKCLVEVGNVIYEVLSTGTIYMNSQCIDLMVLHESVKPQMDQERLQGNLYNQQGTPSSKSCQKDH